MSRKSKMLVATLLGGALVWLWKKTREEGSVAGHREITRWEDEGGALPDGEQVRSRKPSRARNRLRVAASDASGGAATDHTVGSTPDAWKFPRS